MREYNAAAPPETGAPSAATPSSDPAQPAAALRHAAPMLPTDPRLPRSTASIIRTDQPRTAPYKPALMRNTAMPPVAIRSTG
jgi:hypothetical protein